MLALERGVSAALGYRVDPPEDGVRAGLAQPLAHLWVQLEGRLNRCLRVEFGGKYARCFEFLQMVA